MSVLLSGARTVPHLFYERRLHAKGHGVLCSHVHCTRRFSVPRVTDVSETGWVQRCLQPLLEHGVHAEPLPGRVCCGQILPGARRLGHVQADHARRVWNVGARWLPAFGAEGLRAGRWVWFRTLQLHCHYAESPMNEKKNFFFSVTQHTSFFFKPPNMSLYTWCIIII